MGYLITMGILMGIAILAGFLVKVPDALSAAKKVVVGMVFIAGAALGASGAFQYNDAGYCQFIQTVAGQERSTCTTGWYFQGWGQSTAWEHYVTIAHTLDNTGGGSSVSTPYSIRMSDNWNGVVTQITRFAIPQDKEQFQSMHRAFRSKNKLIQTTLKPAITQSLDSVSNMFSMEDYYAGGQRDQYKTEFSDAVIKGRAKVEQQIRYVAVDESGGQAANDMESSGDTSKTGIRKTRQVRMVKVNDENGNPIREIHDYAKWGITVASVILENLDPDDVFEDQIAERKAAASRRMVAQTKRGEQEEQRLLAIATGDTDIAIKQAATKVLQIEQTTKAETVKKLALIKASQIKQEAFIAKETAAIKLEQAVIDAEAVVVTADANAYEREALLASDNGLALKLEALVQMNEDNAKAFANRSVPTTVVYTNGGDAGSLGANDEIANIATTQMLKNLKALDLDVGIKVVK